MKQLEIMQEIRENWNFPDKFSKFKNKIDYIIVNDLPLNVQSKKLAWKPCRDHQRNSLSQGIDQYEPNDLIMISDIDEIPDPKKINEFEIKNKYGCFLQKNFQSKINLWILHKNIGQEQKFVKKI